VGIKDRPYVGSWELGKQTIVRHTPDARVLINGQAEFAVCATCNKKTDFNKYITSVTVDPSTDPISTASISLSIPRHQADVFSHDGNYVLEPGLEVVIQMRGYFPVAGYAAKGQVDNFTDSEGSRTRGSPLEETPVYPYYQVFRGVVTEASHEFSGGFYTASLSCANILHFWQYLYLSTNGSVFGARSDDSSIQVDLRGHKFTGMSPYAIIYTLMRAGFGSAFGVNWTIAQETNISAIDDSSGTSLYKHASLWWEKRWQESSMRLRMYGFDGNLFNAYTQSWLGLFNPGGKGNRAHTLINKFSVRNTEDKNFQATPDSVALAVKAIGYKGTETVAQVAGTDGMRLDAAKMQAYTFDLGSLGQVNLFESEYLSKLEIAQAALTITGFEFYQDVDGDIVFKPPFFNLDTADDPVYRISDRDLISISESETEPEATYVKGSGSIFQNFTGVLSGEFGTREGKFVDWRLVAKFGWKETSFESHYYSNSKQMFIAGIMRLDLANMESKSASITIPLRPELRPGYPVYVEHLDCYFYVKSLSHSFTPGSSCQTTLTCAAKRAKWLPPGLPDRSEGGGVPSLKDVHLDAPGDYPPMPLYAFPEDLEGGTAGSSGPPRIIGYPNVVLALDPNKINPRTIPGLPTFTGDTLFDTALALGALRRNPDDENTYLLANSDDPATSQVIQRTAIVTAFNEINQNISNTQSTEDQIAAITAENPELGAILTSVLQDALTSIPDAENLSRYMVLQRSLKNVFGAGGENSPPGEYRYYSSSAPDPEDQSPSEFIFDQETGKTTYIIPGAPEIERGLSVLREEEGRIKVQSGTPDRAFRVYGLSADSEGSPYVDISTRDIRFLNFTRLGVRVRIDVSTENENGVLSSFTLNSREMGRVMAAEMVAYAERQFLDEGSDTDVADLFGVEDKEGKGYGGIYNAILNYALDLGIAQPGPKEVDDALERYDPEKTGSTRSGQGGGFYNAFGSFSYKKDVEEELPGLVDVSALTDEQKSQLIFQGVAREPDNLVSTGPNLDDPNVSTIVVSEYLIQTLGLPRAKAPSEKTFSRSKIGNIRSVTGRSKMRGIKALANRLGTSLGKLLAAVQNGFRAYVIENGIANIEDELDIRRDFLQFFTGYQESQGGKFTFVTPTYIVKHRHTAVLPVSDNKGYEVYGSLAYGRGLSIRSYRELLGNQGLPTTAGSLLATEAFVAALAKNEADISRAVQALGEESAQLAATLGVDDNVDSITSAIETIVSDDSNEIYIRNTPVTSRSRGMSNTFGVSAEELAGLTSGEDTVCLCKGVEATHFIQAFTGDFVELRGDEAVNDFLEEEVAVSGISYQTTKQALSGRALDTRFENELERVAKNAYESVRSTGRAIESQFTQTINDLASAAASLDSAEGDE